VSMIRNHYATMRSSIDASWIQIGHRRYSRLNSDHSNLRLSSRRMVQAQAKDVAAFSWEAFSL
jgi:hypothetical protein